MMGIGRQTHPFQRRLEEVVARELAERAVSVMARHRLPQAIARMATRAVVYHTVPNVELFALA